MRVTSKGQVTIPKHVRDKLDIQPGSEVAFVIEGQTVTLVRADLHDEGASRVRAIKAFLDRIRGTATEDLTTDEIMDMTRGPYDDVEPR